MSRTTTDNDDQGSRDSTTELLWGTREPTNRGPKPALSLERIAAVGLRIADTEGLAAVSMQRVAGELNFTKMSLYRYVAGKSELLAIMIEAAVGEPPDLSRMRRSWRGKVEEFLRQLAGHWQHHTWLPWATVGDRVMGPNEMGWIECAVSAFEGTGLTGGEILDAVFLLFGHIRNTQSMTTAGTQPWTPDKQLSPAITNVVPQYDERFPALTAAVRAAGRNALHDNGREFGVRRILDGLELLISERAAKR